jgi:ribose 5-phosphate isomerase B
MKVYIGSDHAGYDLKRELMDALHDVSWSDMGTHSKDSVDYPDLADQVCSALIKDTSTNSNSKSFGVLICGSGQGMAMRANKFPEIRAALVYEPEMAALARQHNNANVLVLGGRVTSLEKAIEIFKVFATTNFEGGRHSARVAKLSKRPNTL